jgi:DNA polymerase-3 subunit epsilon
MRQLIIDTETTGLDPHLGHRIIELAAIEVVNRRATGRTVHFRIDPERDIDAGATEVHGMTWEDLKGQPKFRDVAAEFLDFAAGAQWVIHNAPFDVAFLDAELAKADMPTCAQVHADVIDTLALARELFPGKRNNLNALCERFGISNAQRTLHGALLDAELLAEVYLAMTRGQDTLTIDIAAPVAFARPGDAAAGVTPDAIRAPLKVIAPTAAELCAHADYLAALDAESRGQCIWLRLAPAPGPTAA